MHLQSGSAMYYLRDEKAYRAETRIVKTVIQEVHFRGCTLGKAFKAEGY